MTAQTRQEMLKFLMVTTLLITFILLAILNAFQYHPRDWTSRKSVADLFPASLVNAVVVGTPARWEKVVIGLVSCSKDKEIGQQLEAAAVHMKSIMISAKLNHVQEIDFHIFLEHEEHQQFFSLEIQKYYVNQSGYQTDFSNVKINAYFHSAVETIPERYRKDMVYCALRCSYIRLFLPSSLPNVDSILYLDVDTLVTGDISQLWQHFRLMNSSQLIGIARNDEPYNEQTWNRGFVRVAFGDNPIVLPTGVNSGVLLMNLTRMREFGWEKKVLQVYREYRDSPKMNDQLIVNILLFKNPGIYKLLDCKFNIMHVHCDHGLVCDSAKMDPTGIHVLHGANHKFRTDNSFKSIWKLYQDFNVQTQGVYKDLVLPIKRLYPSNLRKTPDCFVALSRYLWKDARKMAHRKL